MIVGGVHQRLSTFLGVHRQSQGDLISQFNWVYGALMRYSPAYAEFSRVEGEFNTYLLTAANEFFGGRFYHGGVTGLGPGDSLLSRARGGFRHRHGDQFPDGSRRLVFLSQRLEFAMCFAVPLMGSLYEVQPDESLTIAPFYLRALRLFQAWIGEKPVLEFLVPYCLVEFSCKAATVLKVCDPVTPDYDSIRLPIPVPEGSIIRRKAQVCGSTG